MLCTCQQFFKINKKFFSEIFFRHTCHIMCTHCISPGTFGNGAENRTMKTVDHVRKKCCVDNFFSKNFHKHLYLHPIFYVQHVVHMMTLVTINKTLFSNFILRHTYVHSSQYVYFAGNLSKHSPEMLSESRTSHVRKCCHEYFDKMLSQYFYKNCQFLSIFIKIVNFYPFLLILYNFYPFLLILYNFYPFLTTFMKIDNFRKNFYGRPCQKVSPNRGKGLEK